MTEGGCKCRSSVAIENKQILLIHRSDSRPVAFVELFDDRCFQILL